MAHVILNTGLPHNALPLKEESGRSHIQLNWLHECAQISSFLNLISPSSAVLIQKNRIHL